MKANFVLFSRLVYDPISKNLFWTSQRDTSIRAIDTTQASDNLKRNLDLVKQVIQLDENDKPRGIAIEPCMGMVFWANWNEQASSIQRCDVTGQNLQSIITTDIRRPIIAIDADDHKLYWADERLDSRIIERADYDGRHRVILAHSTLEDPTAITVHKNYLYFTDSELEAVVRVDKYSGGDATRLRTEISSLSKGIVAIHNWTVDCVGL